MSSFVKTSSHVFSQIEASPRDDAATASGASAQRLSADVAADVSARQILVVAGSHDEGGLIRSSLHADLAASFLLEFGSFAALASY